MDSESFWSRDKFRTIAAICFFGGATMDQCVGGSNHSGRANIIKGLANL